MVWVVVGAVAVILFGLTWWLSGRAKPGPDIARRVEIGGAEGKAMHQVNQLNSSGPRSL